MSDSGFYVCNAANAYGSDSALLHLTVHNIPYPPVNVRGVDVHSTSATIMWDSVYEGLSSIDMFVLTYQPMEGIDDPKLKNVPSPHTFVKLNNLHPATMYHVYVTAKNHVGESEKSVVAAFTTAEAAPSGPPENVQAYAISSTIIQVIWELPEASVRNGVLRGYYVNYRKHNTSVMPYITVKKVAGNGSFDHINLVDLEKFSQYDINVQAFNFEGTGPKSEDVQQYTKEDVPDAGPETVTAVALSSTSITLVWSPPPLQSLNGILQGYKIHYAPVIDGQVQEELTAVSNRLNFILVNLQKFCVYTIQISAFTRVGDGVKSNPVLVITKQDIPGVPAGIKTLMIAANTVLVTWKPPMEKNGELAKYTLYMNDGKDEVEFDLDPREESDIIHNLTENHEYKFKVSASTSAGEGVVTEYVAITPTEHIVAAIVSFPTTFLQPLYSSVMLPCLAVGDPKPTLSWSKVGSGQVFDDGNHIIYHQNGSLELINVTRTGNEGNYTCTVKNMYGTDSITHDLLILEPPKCPDIHVLSTDLNHITVGWNVNASHNVQVTSITLMFKQGHKQWKVFNLPYKQKNYTFSDLNCGTKYFVKAVAHSKVGNSSYCVPLHINTKGSVPTLPEDNSLLHHINSTFIVLNLATWRSGSCGISYFDIDIQKWNDKSWSRVEHHISNNVSKYMVAVEPKTWYTIKITANNPAGSIDAYFKLATKSFDGSTIPPPIFYNIKDHHFQQELHNVPMVNPGPFSGKKDHENNLLYYYLIIPITAILVVVLIVWVWIYLHYRYRKTITFGAQRLAESRKDNNTTTSLLTETIDKESESIHGTSNSGGQYSRTPTRQLNPSTLVGDTYKTKPPIIYERRTVLLNSSNESFQSDGDSQIMPYATFQAVEKQKDAFTADESTPLKVDNYETSTFSQFTNPIAAEQKMKAKKCDISANLNRQNSIDDEKKPEEETKLLML